MKHEAIMIIFVGRKFPDEMIQYITASDDIVGVKNFGMTSFYSIKHRILVDLDSSDVISHQQRKLYMPFFWRHIYQWPQKYLSPVSTISINERIGEEFESSHRPDTDVQAEGESNTNEEAKGDQKLDDFA